MSTSNSGATPPSFFQRIPLAIAAFFSTLSDARFAAGVQRLQQGQSMAPESPRSAAPAPAPVPAPAPAPAPAPSPVKQASPDAALQLIALLQRDARLIDFVEEDLSGHADADIGVAARVVHEGCRKVLREHFTLEPVRSEPEGARITLNPGFDASAVRITGQVVGQPPFHGSLTHRGWRAAEVRLPKLAEGHDPRVLAQAEVEL